MSFPKLLILIGLVLFGTIGVAAVFKKKKTLASSSHSLAETALIEIDLEPEIKPLQKEVAKETVFEVLEKKEIEQVAFVAKGDSADLPVADRIAELFNKQGEKLRIVETITYKSRVAWQKGRPAWLSDYASHFATSRHFIARSLNGKPDYFKQEIGEGDQFNVLRSDVNLNFYLLIDISRSKMWFYALDQDNNERILLKTYQVGLGRPDKEKTSGLLTPIGKYSLGNKIAIYKPKTMGFHNGSQIEMVSVFGSRWIPFEKEVAACSSPAKGFGIHGVPWNLDKKGEPTEDISSLGKYESDGCIRLATADIEELFAIIITKPTIVELVRDFYDAKLPGIEK